MPKTKIIIAGIGGVGGYFGGLLAKCFYKSNEVEIYFIARGEHLKQIQTNGLKVIKGANEFVAQPVLATDNPNEIGVADYIIICTKSYDLEATIQQLKPCINNGTVILPLLNGVDNSERIKKLLPDNTVLEGCVYIVSRIKQAGVVENMGNIETLYFGLPNTTNEKLLLLETLMKQAGINSTLSENILPIMWEKLIFLSPTATATSYFDNSTGQVIEDDEKLKMLTSLIREVSQIAVRKNIAMPNDIVEKTINKLKALPYETTSSMYRDFKDHKKTELESITGYAVKAGKELNVETPTFNVMYNELAKRSH